MRRLVLNRDVAQDAARDGIDVASAASLLGISPQAVRKRVRRGSLTAHKVDGEWRIVLPASYATAPDAARPAAQAAVLSVAQDAGSATVQAAVLDTGRPDGEAAAYPAYRELIDQLKVENAFLRGQVEQQAAIIAELTQHIPAPAEPSARDAAIVTKEAPQPPPPRRSSPWWRRVLRALTEGG